MKLLKGCDEQQQVNIVFDYRIMRMSIGIIALLFPLVLCLAAGNKLPHGLEALPSLSYAYHTDAYSVYIVGLSVVAWFLVCYNGHSVCELLMSKVAAMATMVVALTPPAQDPTTINGVLENIHFVSAGVLMLTLSCFCFIFFQRHTKKSESVKPRRRSKLYFICGGLMILSIVVILVATELLERKTVIDLRIIFWFESLAFMAFGLAWLVSGKTLTWFTRGCEKPGLFQKPNESII